jgi:hypothetical protein
MPSEGIEVPENGLGAVQGQATQRKPFALDRVNFAAPALRADVGGGRVSPAQLYSAAELIDRADDVRSLGPCALLSRVSVSDAPAA